MTMIRKSLNILVAEDDDLIGELLGEMLVDMGHQVCAVETSQTGTVAAARRFLPDLLIVDLRLRPGSGVAAIDQIMQNGFIPHILVSGNIARLRELRPDAVLLQKPYTQAALASAIERTSQHA